MKLAVRYVPATVVALTFHLFASDFSDHARSMTPADSVPADTAAGDPAATRFSFRADRVEFRKALTLFANANGLTAVCEADAGDTVSIAFSYSSFDEGMRHLLSGRHLRWRIDNGIVIVSAASTADSSAVSPTPLEIKDIDGSRVFTINYPRLKRSGQGSSTASISSAASGQAGSVQLSTGDEILFWQELEEQLKLLISPGGKLIVNKMAGIVHVADSKDRLDAIQAYLRIVVPAATRQVEITARIYEVSLDKDHSLGIDWTLLSQQVSKWGYSGVLGGASHMLKISPEFKASTADIDCSVDGKVSFLLRALQEQGDVQAISQPRIMTLNNQPALIKIGTDYPYFSANVTINPTTGQKEVQEAVHVITVGVVLSLTPQISDDGWITMGIDPLISDLVSTATSINGSTAPIIDVKQSSALVRLRDRSTVRISGLLQTKKSVMTRKIPILGDIPVLKYLFRWNYSKLTRKELVIFITPRRI